MSATYLRKRAADTRAFTVDVEDQMRDGDEIAGVSAVAVTQSGSGVTISSLAYEGTKIEFVAAGGTPGDYHLRLVWTATEPAQTLSAIVELKVV